MPKIIKSGQDARESIFKGVDVIGDLVGATLGPKGRNIILDRGYGSPVITNDGVTIAKEISLEDKFENVGVQLIQEVADKTNSDAGDGTTTATVLAQAILANWKKVEGDLYSTKRGMDKAVKDVVAELLAMKKDIQTSDEVAQIATISSLDPQVGKLIAEIMDEVGRDGTITVEEGQKMGLEKEVVKGMRFDKGYVSPYLATDQERMEAVIEDPYILVTDRKITSVQEIMPALEVVNAAGKKEIVIIAEGFEGEALATIVMNKVRGAFNILAIPSPGYGDRKKEMLQDIAVLTNAEFFSQDLGNRIENVSVMSLGRAKKVTANSDTTTIIGGLGSQAKIDARVAEIKASIEKATSQYDKEKLLARIARLVGGIGVIKVGAATETEMKNLKYKIEDALNATRAAVAEGIVVGGGSALLKVAKKLYETFNDKFDGKNPEDIGYGIILESIKAPITKIATNAGLRPEDIIPLIVPGDNKGYNFATDEITDLFEAGVIDPVKVTRSALQNAASIASSLMTTEGVIVEKQKQEKELNV